MKRAGVGWAHVAGRLGSLGGAIDALGCGWYYNWTESPTVVAAELGAEFVPMIWGAAGATDAALAAATRAGSGVLLGFNEPDKRSQANLSVKRALDLWPRLEATGLRLGSPAAADRPWLERFMEGADERGLRVDFVCLHWYGDVTDPGAVAGLRGFLTDAWERYRRPVWLTEFSGSTGRWLAIADPPVTAERNAAFVREVVPMLEGLPFLERYAWFELAWRRSPWKTVALVDPATGDWTPVGEAWADAVGYFTSISSTSKMRVSSGPMAPPAPRLP